MARVWPNVFVELSNLTVHIAVLRRVLGDGLNGNRYLVDIPGRGYRFVAPVSTADKEMPWSAQPSGPAVHPDIFGVHGFAVCGMESPQLLAGQEARDPTKAAETRGHDRNRCARCPIAKMREPRFLQLMACSPRCPRCFPTSWSQMPPFTPDHDGRFELIPSGRTD